MKGLIFVGLILLAGISDAREWGVQAHIASWHPDGGKHNESNPGLGVVYRGEFAAVGGFYKNSEYRTSVYAGFGQEIGNLRIMIGAATGYVENSFGGSPVLFGPIIQYGVGPVFFTYIPNAIGIGLEF